MQLHGSLEGVEIKKAGLRLGFFLQGVWAKIQGSSISRGVGRGRATFSHTKNTIIEIYLGTLQARDFFLFAYMFHSNMQNLL